MNGREFRIRSGRNGGYRIQEHRKALLSFQRWVDVSWTETYVEAVEREMYFITGVPSTAFEQTPQGGCSGALWRRLMCE